MQPLQKLILSFCSIPAFLGLHAQTDSSTDCFDKFFARTEKISSPAKTILVTKAGKTITLASFLKTAEAEGSVMGMETKHGLIDLDNDGKKELVIYDYTGGAHCCDEFYFFKNISLNKYQQVGKTVAGDVCVNEQNEFVFDFYQQFGYFFTCFACEYQDSTDAAPIPLRNIVLKYNKGKLNVVPGDQDLKSQVTDNLGKLSEKPYQPLHDAADQDNGLRKEFALNLAVFYYSFGRNIAETKKLFDKYYKYADAKKVWALFASEIRYMQTADSF